LRNSKQVILLLVVVLILGMYWYYLHKADVPVSSKQKPIAVPSIKVKQATLPNRVHTLGTIHVQRQLDVYSSVTGEVVSVRVKPKEHVKKNAILIQVGNPSYREQVKEVEAELRRAKQAYKNYLDASAVLSRKKLDALNAVIKRRKFALKQLKKEVSVTSVRAPISGYVEKLSVKVGDKIKEANLVAMIIDRDNIVVKYLLPGKYSGAVKLGQKVIVKRIAGSKKETTIGTVTKVDRSGTKYIRDIHVTASLPKPGIPLKPGLIVSVTQILETS